MGGRLATYLKQRQPACDIVLTTTRDNFPAWSSAFTVVVMQLTDEKSITSCIETIQPEVIVHLAGLPQKACQDDPDLAEKINVQGTQALLTAAQSVGVKQLVYFSTFQVYGHADKLQGEITEKTVCNPESVYGRTKLAAENIVRQFSGHMRTIIFRLSNGFGAPADLDVAESVWRLVFNAFCLSALREHIIKPLGNPCRDFIPMDDVVRAVDYTLFSQSANDSDMVFNLGGGNCMSMVEVGQLIARQIKVQKGIEVDVDDDFKEPQERFVYDVQSFQSAGFSFNNNVEEEVNKLIERCAEKNG